MKKFVLASKNKGKLNEFKKLLNGLDIEIVLESDFNIEEIIENGKTFEENSLIKAKTVGDITGLPTIADDSGLCIDVLEGKPGLYTARVFNEYSEYINRCEKMIEWVNDAGENRNAYFISVITLYYPKTKEYHFFEGKVYGEITHKIEGVNGHGYDPIFYSFELEKTFGMANDFEKNSVSHRARATQKLKEFLENK